MTPRFRSVRLVVAVAAIVVGALAQHARPAAALKTPGYGADSRPSSDAWAEFRGGPLNRGDAPGKAPTFERILWSEPCGAAVFQQPAVKDGRVYVASIDGVLHCREAATGREIFKVQAVEPGGVAPAQLTYSSPLLAFGRVYLGSEKGTLFSFDAENGTLVFGARLGERIWAAPKTDGRMIVVSTLEGDIFGVEPFGGDVLWRAMVGVEIGSTAAIVGDEAWVLGFGGRTTRVDLTTGRFEVLEPGFSSSATPAVGFGGLFFRDARGRFSCFDLLTKSVRWSVKEPGDWNRSGPACDGERVYFAAHGGVRVFDPTSGEKLWEFPVMRYVHTSPVTARGRVYFGADDGFVRMLDSATGAELKSFDVGHPLVGSFAIADGRLFLADGVKGVLHAIN